jgi:hypothetical protein
MLDKPENLPRLELTSSLNNWTNLDGWDIDNDLFGQVNCEYYTICLFHAMRPGLKSAIFGWQNDW